jgi:hypothetical protein
MMDEITDIKRRAGIVEFVPGPEFNGNDEPANGGGPPLSEQLNAIARGTQGVGRIDQHQIEIIFRAAQLLKKLGR